MGRNIRPLLLVIGAVLGLLLAVPGLVELKPSISENDVAIINGKHIPKSHYQFIMTFLKRINPEAKRTDVIKYIVEEELLVQKALELGLASSDQKVRNFLAKSLKALVAERTRLQNPDDVMLKRVYEENLDVFIRPPQYSLRQLLTTYKEKAEQAYQDLERGKSWDSVVSLYENTTFRRLPESPISEPTLRRYVGPESLQSIIDQPIGGYTRPQKVAGRYSIYLVTGKAPLTAPSFPTVRNQVEEFYLSRAVKAAVEEYISKLREDAVIQIREE